MCGKFTFMATYAEVFDFSHPLVQRTSNAPEDAAIVMRWAPVMHLNDAGNRAMTPMRWGYCKYNREGREYPDLIHARDDKLLSYGPWRDAFENGRRGLLIVTSFYEARPVPTYKPDRVTPTGNFKDEPWVMRPKDGSRLAIACLYRNHRTPDGWIYEFVMVTSKANKRLEEIVAVSEDGDKRMPAIIREEDIPKWLGEEYAEPEDIRDLIQPYEDDGAWEYKAEPKPKPPPKPKAGGPPKPQDDLF
jgi:putative SOS response-associated peptidase YedK